MGSYRSLVEMVGCRLLALTLVLSFIANSSHGLTCYKCDKPEKGCGDVVEDGEYGEEQECVDKEGKKSVCRRWAEKDGKVYKRLCDEYHLLPHEYYDGCTNSTKDGETLCWCDTDLCNSSESFHGGSFTSIIILPVVAALFAAFSY